MHRSLAPRPSVRVQPRGKHAATWASTVKMIPTCRAGRTDVLEMLLLVEAAPGTTDELKTEMLEELWSLQYRSPGILCSAAGRLIQTPSSSTLSTSLAGSSHAVHFRFGNAAAAQGLTKNPVLQAVLQPGGPSASGATGTSLDACKRASSMCFEGNVESDVDALFRRTPDYAEGIDHVMILEAVSSAITTDAATKLLQQFAALAQSSLAGAVQVSYGRLVKGPNTIELGNGETQHYVMMSRFISPEQLAAFRATAPMKALWAGGQGMPLRGEAQFEMIVAPAEASRSKMGQPF